jgi:class 3 adenylate cyclase
MVLADRPPEGSLISSKEVLEKTGISRVTLHNYIKLGLIPPPIIGLPPRDMKKTRKIGYFPASVLDTLSLIDSFKKKGYSLEMISREWKGQGAAQEKEQTEPPEKKGIRNEAVPGLKVSPPCLRPLAVLVADLQNADKISGHLLPAEFLDLMAQLWSAMEPIFVKYRGIRLHSPENGLARVFLADGGGSYQHVLDAIHCVSEMRRKVSEIDLAWKGRKKWDMDLCLRTGIHEGREWIGLIVGEQLVALGDTVRETARLCELAYAGGIWASKQCISVLPPEIQDKIAFGIRRLSLEGEGVLSTNFARVMDVIDLNRPENFRFADISTLSVTEIIAIDREFTAKG